MRPIVLVGVALLGIGCVAVGRAGPVPGNVGTYLKLEPGESKQVKLLFRGNERACVILIGDHEPVQPLAVSVYDEAGKLVAKDSRGSDLCAVLWYPPRTALYTIRLANDGQVWNKCWLAIK